jgi:uncharacterized protein (TIGR02284 family)
MTTTDSHHAEPNEIVFALNTCIEACTDGEKGYALAAADVRDPELKEICLERAVARAHFVAALQQAVEELGGFPENQGSAMGTAHRGWVSVRKLVEGRSDRMIAEECERAEHLGLNAYQVALRHAPLPEGLLGMLERQYATILADLNDLHRRFA